MNKNIPRIESAADALVWLDYLARFSGDDGVGVSCRGIAIVIRELLDRAERQAMRLERYEAASEAKQ